jgi:hypothetical protein
MLETAILGLAGGSIGVMIAALATDLATSIPPLGGVLHFSDVNVNRQALVFACVVSVSAILIVGLLPALRARFPSKALAAFEVAISLVLVAGTGLALRTFLKIAAIDPGFNPSGVLTMPIDPAGLDDPVLRRSYFARLLEEVRSVPGVKAAGLVSGLAFKQADDWYFEVEGRLFSSLADRRTALYRHVSADYFRAMGIPLRQGPSFTPDEVSRAVPAAIVDERLVNMFLPGEDPLGQRIIVYVNPLEKKSYEIVGVAGSVLPGPAADLYQTIYVPGVQNSGAMTLVVRATGPPESVVSALRDALRRVDKDLPVSQMTPMGDVVTGTMSDGRTATALMSVFSGIGIGLAAIGLCAVLLGSSERDVPTQIISEGTKLSLMGMAFGLTGAYVFSQLLGRVLVGIPSIDPVTFVIGPIVLAVVAFAASCIPARRAAGRGL